MEESSVFNLLGIILLVFLLQLLLMIVQLVGASIRTVIFINNKQSIGKLKTYWVMVSIYILVLVLFYAFYHFVLFAGNHRNGYYSNNYLDKSIMDSAIAAVCFVYALVGWFFLAWVIIIWYWIKIVFIKNKIINHEN